MRGGPGLAELLRELGRIEGLRWMRLLYCYPSYFTDELIDEIATNPKARSAAALLRRSCRCLGIGAPAGLQAETRADPASLALGCGAVHIVLCGACLHAYSFAHRPWRAQCVGMPAALPQAAALVQCVEMLPEHAPARRRAAAEHPDTALATRRRPLTRWRRAQVCKYIDIPLQHICNLTLLAMNRPPREHTERLLRTLRARIPGLALRTTFISGFPGAPGARRAVPQGAPLWWSRA